MSTCDYDVGWEIYGCCVKDGENYNWLATGCGPTPYWDLPIRSGAQPRRKAASTRVCSSI